MKCNIIQDLLPSYADEICSEDTRELVDEHIAECSECREKLEQMKNTVITTGKAADKQIDYLKKVRSMILHKERLGKLILVLLVGITYMGFFVGYGGLINYEQIPSVVFCILLLCAAGLAGNWQFSDNRKAIIAGTGISGAVFIFCLLINEYVTQNLINLKAPFPFLGIELHQVGPFYSTILKIIALIVVIALMQNTFGRHKNACASILNIAALSQLAYANDWLFHMDTPDSYLRAAHELALSHIVLAAVSIIICVLLRKSGKI